MSDQRKERNCVLRLLATLGGPPSSFLLECLDPPAPDVRVTYEDRSIEVFEVTEIHPDEASHGGSPARAQEERRARGNPHAIVPSWVPVEALPAIRRRVEEKCKKAVGYTVQPHETLSLLLVGSQPLIGAVASTYVFASFVTPDRLNAELNECLATSRFQRAYLHLQFSGNAAWVWSRQTGWTVLRAPEDTVQESLKMLEALKPLGSGAVPPGTQIFGRPR